VSKLGGLVYKDLMARGRKEATARQWRDFADKFASCCGVKKVYGREDVIEFLAQLRREGYKQSSIDVMIRPVRLLAQIQRWPGGFPRLAMSKVRVGDVERPFLNHDEVCEMIRRAKMFCNRRELAYLALSTTYGLRRAELASLEICDGEVTVDTVKGGVVTTHIIPDEIKPYIGGYRCADIRYVSLMFRRICEKVGYDFEGRNYGWHAIRRALATELVEVEMRMSVLNIIRFMRWSDDAVRGEFGMLVVYAQRDQAKIDRSIFKVHPFLGSWR
jgi:integrase